MEPHDTQSTMKLRICLPGSVLLESEAVKIVARDGFGAFGLLPRHIDFATALVPGVLTMTDRQNTERFVGHDDGVLVKRGRDLMISVQRAVTGLELGELRKRVEAEFIALEEHDVSTRSALSRLEAGIIRWFIDTQHEK